MSRVAFPFLTLRSETVEASPWEIASAAGDFRAVGEYLPDWDYTTSIRIRRTIRIRLEAAAQDLDIPGDDLALAVVVRAGTGASRLPRRIIMENGEAVAGGEAIVEMDIPGHQLSSALYLGVIIVLARSPERAGELSPRCPGDCLWHDDYWIRLEGDEPRFPIEIADFHALFGNGTAQYSPWYLRWMPGDWERDFHGALRLYLNAKDPAFISRVEEGDAEILRCLMADVMGQICEAMLRNDDAQEIMTRCEEGSLGHQVWNWLSLAFPGDDLDRVRAHLEHRPGEFRAAIMAVAEQKEDET